jgi:hypothetical protein
VAGAFPQSGQFNIVLRQWGGGQGAVLYGNHFPKPRYPKASPRGTMKEYEPGRRSNRLDVGARLVAVVNGQQLVRELYPLNSYLSQIRNVVHFGLGDAEGVEKLTVLWPSGLRRELTDLAGDRRVVVEEGSDEVQTVTPGRPIMPEGAPPPVL